MILNQIDELMKRGYEARSAGNAAGACHSWRKAWNLISEIMQSSRYPSIETLDQDFGGRESISSWAGDYTTELKLAGDSDPQILLDGIEFGRQYLEWSSKPYTLNNQNIRRMIGENTFKLGRPAAGDDIFAGFLADNPGWGWGWLSWANQYCLHQQAPWYDLNRAEAILRQALKIDGLSNRPLITAQLRDVLIRQGRTIEASTIQ